MANVLYPKWKEGLAQGSANYALNGTVKAVLVDTGVYTYSAAHQYYSSVSDAAVGTPETLGSKTFTNGVFDAADVTFSALTGDTAEAIVIIVDTGSAATSPVVAYIDSGVGNLPVTPNGGDVSIAWNASGIFAL